MDKFDFSNLQDLNLSPLESLAVHNIFDKAKVNQIFWNETAQMFVENYIRCLKTCISLNVVPSVMAAQGIDESGWFSTRSLFGVKATKIQVSQGQGTDENTEEVVSGLAVHTTGKFFETPSIQNNFTNYFDYIINRKPNSKQFLPSDALGFIQYLQDPTTCAKDSEEKSGAYSTAGQEYVDTIMSIIRSNNLQAFDHF